MKKEEIILTIENARSYINEIYCYVEEFDGYLDTIEAALKEESTEEEKPA